MAACADMMNAALTRVHACCALFVDSMDCMHV